MVLLYVVPTASSYTPSYKQIRSEVLAKVPGHTCGAVHTLYRKVSVCIVVSFAFATPAQRTTTTFLIRLDPAPFPNSPSRASLVHARVLEVQTPGNAPKAKVCKSPQIKALK